MSNPCRICSDPRWSDKAGGWALEGVSDREVARRLGIDKSLVTRHRQRHVIAPLQHRLAIASKGDAPRQEREALASAAASGAPSTEAVVAAAIGLQAQVRKLEMIESRLERMATAAEDTGSFSGVAVLSAQALRGVEVGSRLAGAGAYAPQRGEQAGAGASFSVQIVFSGSGHTETFTTSSRPIIDSEDFKERDTDNVR